MRAADILLGALIASATALVASQARATIEVDGKTLQVVDMHLHPGHFGQIPEGGVTFLAAATPAPTRLFAPALFEHLLDPYAEQVGVQAQTSWAGVDHAVLLAVYTHHTSGYFTNSQLEEALVDKRNVSTDPDPNRKPWAWGMVSIDYFDGFEGAGVAEARLKALSSFFEKRRDLFIGIKLAHAHQAVAFDDPQHMGVYDVAATHKVPVLLHTGFSPFPNSMTDPAYYDPQGLENVVLNYDGNHGLGRVNFVLSHVGQGDARAVEHALQLAEKHDNVYLEVSALKRPLLIDDKGNPVQATEYQYPYVLEQIKVRKLISRTMWATDGPQFSGMVRSYLQIMVQGMKDAQYTVDEIAALLSGNFYSLYFPAKE